MIRSAKKQENVIPNQGKQKQSIEMEIARLPTFEITQMLELATKILKQLLCSKT